jgi:hypothetical protein
MIGSAALHEQQVADDRGAVPDEADRDEGGGQREPRRDGGEGDAGRPERQRDDVHARDAEAVDPATAVEAADGEPQPGRADEDPEAQVAGVEYVLREEDLRDVEERVAYDGDTPDDEDHEERP